jgi:hypothetical protein
VEFFVGGLGRDPQTQAPKPDCPYPDIPKITTGLVQLSDRWQRFSLALPPTVARSRVINGFGWWQRARPDGSSVIFIDTISYDWARADERHLPPSFVTQDGQLAMDWAQRGFSHTYDVALAIIAMLAMGDVRRARLMADALIYAQQHDPDGNRIDGGVRNCYSGGDLVLPSGWLPTGRDGAVRLAGFWEPMKKVWWQDKYANAVYTGNVAWAGIALVHVYRATGVKKYLDAAIGMGDWILHHAELRDREGHLQSGYKGGIFYWEGKEEPVPWVATEHSIDAYVLFTLLAGADPVAKADWLGGAAHARSFVGSMWAGDHLWTGLKPDGSANRDFVPVDIQGWACLAFGPADFPGALSWALRHCSVEQLDVKGLAFRDMTGLEPDDPGRGVWPEGTAQMVVALREAGKTAEADAYLGQLRAFQRTLLAEGKTGMTAAVGERLVAIPGQQEYFRREHIGATCWCLFAEKGINPYWFGEHPPGGEGR